VKHHSRLPRKGLKTLENDEVSLNDFLRWLEEKIPESDYHEVDSDSWQTLRVINYWVERYRNEHPNLDYVVPEHTSQSFKLDSGQTWKPGIHIENIFNAQGRGQWLSFMSTDKGWTLFLTTEPDCENGDPLRDRVHRESDMV